jgi:hypothetical protein
MTEALNELLSTKYWLNSILIAVVLSTICGVLGAVYLQPIVQARRDRRRAERDTRTERRRAEVRDAVERLVNDPMLVQLAVAHLVASHSKGTRWVALMLSIALSLVVTPIPKWTPAHFLLIGLTLAALGMMAITLIDAAQQETILNLVRRRLDPTAAPTAPNA